MKKRSQKVLSTILALVMLLSMLPTAAWAEEAVSLPVATEIAVESNGNEVAEVPIDVPQDHPAVEADEAEPAGGQEELAAPSAVEDEAPAELMASASYDISTPADLANIANDLAGNYTLQANINLSGIDSWTPIGTFAAPFTGTLDGNGFKIYGLSVNTDVTVISSNTGMGLFGNNGGTIKDLTVEGVTSGNGGDYRSLVAAYNTGTLENITVNGTVTGNDYLGLLAGYSSGTVSGCSADGRVTGTGDWVGGLVGRSAGAILNSASAGSVNGDYYIGGLVGYTSDIVQGCRSTATVSASHYAGGLLGYAIEGSTIENCESESDRIYSYNGYVGGFIGGNYGGTIENCKANAPVEGGFSADYIGGFAGYNSGIITNCFASGQVINVLSYAGGFIGENMGGTVQFCGTTAAVSGSSYVGGFVGQVNGNSIITNCYATGGVVASGNLAGGFVGGNDSARSILYQCYSAGSVSCVGSDKGGFAGINSGTVYRCYYDRERSNQSDTSRGTPLSTEAIWKRKRSQGDPQPGAALSVCCFGTSCLKVKKGWECHADVLARYKTAIWAWHSLGWMRRPGGAVTIQRENTAPSYTGTKNGQMEN